MKAKIINYRKAMKVFGKYIYNEPTENSIFLSCREGLFNAGLISFYVKDNQAYIENIISKSSLYYSSWIWKCLIEAMLINMDELNISNINIVSSNNSEQLEDLLFDWHFIKVKEENDITTFMYQK